MPRRTDVDEMSWWEGLRAHVEDLELRVIMAAAVILGAVLTFLWIADEVSEGDTRNFDEAVLAALRDVGDPSQLIGPRWLESVAANLTSLGGYAVLILLLGAILGFMLLRKAWVESALLALASLGGLGVTILLKSVFARPRPDVVPHLVTVTDLSFPSGHAMMSAVAYLTLGVLLAEFLKRKHLKIYVLVVAFFITFVVGTTRVLLGVHYPSDVVAGWCVGLGWALACWLLVRYAEFKLKPGRFRFEQTREDSRQMHENAQTPRQDAG